MVVNPKNFHFKFESDTEKFDLPNFWLIVHGCWFWTRIDCGIHQSQIEEQSLKCCNGAPFATLPALRKNESIFLAFSAHGKFVQVYYSRLTRSSHFQGSESSVNDGKIH